MNASMKTLRGVNLGGWLVLEKWITPFIFEGLQAEDEFSLCKELKQNKDETLAAHHLSFITYDDFKWIREHGFDTVRIPVPHWVFGDVQPYVGCQQYLDFAFEAAQEHNLSVIIDLHTAPGSQNGYDHSGQRGEVNWHKGPDNIDETLKVIEKLVQAYATKPNLIGFELLNEPSAEIPHDVLLDFYKRGYQIVRKYSDDIAVIVSDGFRPLDWAEAFDETHKNILLDVHLYQSFTEQDKKLTMDQHIQKALNEWRSLIGAVQQNLPVLVGEWSLGLDEHAFHGHDEAQKDLALKAYAVAQMSSFEQAAGWCFWTYKTDNMDGWSAQTAVVHNWLNLNN